MTSKSELRRLQIQAPELLVNRIQALEHALELSLECINVLNCDDPKCKTKVCTVTKQIKKLLEVRV